MSDEENPIDSIGYEYAYASQIAYIYEDEGYESRKQQQDYLVKCEVCNKAYNEEQIRNSDIFPDYENICRVCIE